MRMASVDQRFEHLVQTHATPWLWQLIQKQINVYFWLMALKFGVHNGEDGMAAAGRGPCTSWTATQSQVWHGIFKISNPSPVYSNTFSPTRSPFPNLPKQHHQLETKCWNILFPLIQRSSLFKLLKLPSMSNQHWEHQLHQSCTFNCSVTFG